ncbi:MULTISPECIES: response regulator [unclassified Bradyrhizobium]|uniref:response regulator n=1 Tax=unclassified Bradyrhizobium TaxID=2631580 RepID=UPI0028E30C46|nr:MULTISPECIES: response regulator [unclassified Bradyrhizobium]
MDARQVSRATSTILIVDDDPLVLKATADWCTWMGFFVLTAATGLQALIRAAEHRPDVLLIDVHLPEIDGLSVLSYLSDAAKKAPHVIVMTGRTDEKTFELCDGLAATCIPKGRLFWKELAASLAEIYPERNAAIAQAARQFSAADVRRRPRVLLVDDDVSVKRMLEHRFEGLGVDLLYASDATRGFWKARREHPSVIVTDFCMPNGDANYLLTKLRSASETRDIPVIVQSGRHLSRPIKRKLQEEIDGRPGAARVLRKSSDGAELLDALQRYCGFAAIPEEAPSPC